MCGVSGIVWCCGRRHPQAAHTRLPGATLAVHQYHKLFEERMCAARITLRGTESAADRSAPQAFGAPCRHKRRGHLWQAAAATQDAFADALEVAICDKGACAGAHCAAALASVRHSAAYCPSQGGVGVAGSQPSDAWMCSTEFYIIATFSKMPFQLLALNHVGVRCTKIPRPSAFTRRRSA